jgi:RimJ/RimL family protein N-acetyltransferase
MFNPTLRLETKRLIIRPFTLDDIEPSYQLNLDAEVSRYTHDGGVVSYEEIERRIREDVMGDYARNGYGRFAVDLKASGAFIGFAGLKYLSDMNETDLGYRFKRSAWGQGIATEAGQACLNYGFFTLQLESIIAMTLQENKGSIRVLEKLNFSFEKAFEADGLLANLYRIKSNK